MNDKGNRRTGRCYRRIMRIQKDRRLRTMIRQQKRYYPYRGYIEWGYVDGKWQEVGKYIKYPRSSNRQQYLKHRSCRKVRRYMALPPKGNHYRRVYDYWWNLD